MLKIVVLCASHISVPERALLLKAQIQSIMEQTHKVPMYVSMSGETQIPFKENEMLRIYKHDKQMSQFEHYAFLCSKIEDLENTFCVFCDDDDYSHPERCMFYASTPDMGQKSMLACDALLLMNENVVVNGHEYYMFAVRAIELNKFCEVLWYFDVIKKPVCDLLFGSVLMNSNKLWRTAVPTKWLYAYNNTEKNREYEMDEYRKMIKNKDLMMCLEKIFAVENIGATTVYGSDFITNL